MAGSIFCQLRVAAAETAGEIVAEVGIAAELNQLGLVVSLQGVASLKLEFPQAG